MEENIIERKCASMTIVAVIVTYNRMNKLKQALKCYESQKEKFNHLIIVNNASTDGTKEFLDDWISKVHSFGVTIINNKENLGGAGGFAVGINNAKQLGFDYIFIADDDAYPNNDMLLNLKANIVDDCGCYCTKVVYPDQSIQYAHRRIVKKGLFNIRSKPLLDDSYCNNVFIDHFSFVGVLIKTSLIEIIGLPCSDYFIQYDDTDYSNRIRKYTNVLCVSNSIIIHDVSKEDYFETNWKTYYAIRNYLLLIKKFYPKRYFIFACLIYRMRPYSKKHRKDKLFSEIVKDAVQDAKNNVFGKNIKYLPGVSL